MASQTAADGLSESLHLALTGVGQRWARLKSCLDGCLSRLASYQQRVAVATGRVAALKGHWGQTKWDTGQRFFPKISSLRMFVQYFILVRQEFSYC